MASFDSSLFLLQFTIFTVTKKLIMVMFIIINQVLTFDSLLGRTCLHYAAYYGHFDCLQALLSAAHSSPLANSWSLPLTLAKKWQIGELCNYSLI